MDHTFAIGFALRITQELHGILPHVYRLSPDFFSIFFLFFGGVGAIFPQIDNFKSWMKHSLCCVEMGVALL